MRRILLVLAILTGLVLGSAQRALAWKPFTHIYSGDKAWSGRHGRRQR